MQAELFPEFREEAKREDPKKGMKVHEAIAQMFRENQLPLETEARLQAAIEDVFKDHLPALGLAYLRELRLDARNRVDFFIHLPNTTHGIALEVKIQGRAIQIYRQLERYAQFEAVDEIVLVTNKSMTLPQCCMGKPVHLVKLGVAWL